MIRYVDIDLAVFVQIAQLRLIKPFEQSTLLRKILNVILLKNPSFAQIPKTIRTSRSDANEDDDTKISASIS
ncbi:LOW QUALITY PROTEIN: hypothetical protein ACHAXA_003010 [Cyclostephanos tholiformis]|uniref:Uncharacterized protein n=1 Tax=Cyclostephanos tholiformis TaxID=382380 RepID=A0ABD3SBU2_9STRA